MLVEAFNTTTDSTILAYQRQRQAPVIAVVKMLFLLGEIFWLQLSRHRVRCQSASRTIVDTALHLSSPYSLSSAATVL